MNLAELKKEYAAQDNRATAYPIYVQVQELVCIGVMQEGYSVLCPFGDGETKKEYRHPDLEGAYDDKAELVRNFKEYFDTKEMITKQLDEIEELTVGYIWHPVEFFLTIKGAEKYMRANKHNHGKLRTYVSHFERRNFEMRGLLKEIGFKVQA
ncbi:MAG: hypothetical protein JRJ39_00125 [Deltaproteobacteria bacterium]|nr:hypothetical protein [Deltaproteobacteria bacterium]